MRFIVLLFLLTVPFAFADDVVEVRQFFDEYVELGTNYDIGVAEFYSKDARIITLRDGKDTLEVSGAQWRALIEQLMQGAEQRGDVSTFSDIQIDPRGDGYRISALRSSSRKCTEGSDFYQDVERSGDQWVIVEEYTETVSLSQCEPSEELAEMLSTVRDIITPHLPLTLDADTRLESIEVRGVNLIYNMRLHTLAASDLDLAQAEPMLKQIGFQNACGDPNVRDLIRKGATVRYVTVDSGGERLATVDVSPGLCSLSN